MPPAKNLLEPERARRSASFPHLQGLPFALVGDESHGQFRADLDAIRLTYLAQVPGTLKVYLGQPVEHVLETSSAPSEVPCAARSLITHPNFIWRAVQVHHPLGLVEYPCAAGRVWTIMEDQLPREEWLFMRQEMDGSLSFALSNAPDETSLEQLADWHNQAYLNEQALRLLERRTEKR